MQKTADVCIRESEVKCNKSSKTNINSTEQSLIKLTSVLKVKISLLFIGTKY